MAVDTGRRKAGERNWRLLARAVHRQLHRLGRRIAAPVVRRGRVGAGTLVERSVHVLGWRSVRIGRNCVIGGSTTFNVNNGRKIDRILIGDNSYIGRFSFFSNGALIRLGDYCLVGPGCRFLGADHVFSDPFRPYISTGVTDDGQILVGANCWLGADVTLLGSLTIGHGSVIGACALVSSDVLPFSLVIGRPARVVKRFDMTSRAWVPIAEFTPEMEAMLPDEASYLSMLRAVCPAIAMPYAAAGPSRGDLA